MRFPISISAALTSDGTAHLPRTLPPGLESTNPANFLPRQKHEPFVGDEHDEWTRVFPLGKQSWIKEIKHDSADDDLTKEVNENV